MSAFNLFANLDDFANEKNHSFSELESKAVIDISNDADTIVDITPPVQSRKRGRRNVRGLNEVTDAPSKKKSTNVVVVDLDIDENVVEVVAVPGIGQKTAYKKFNALKKSIETTVKTPKCSSRSSRSSKSSTVNRLREDMAQQQIRTRLQLQLHYNNELSSNSQADAIIPQHNKSTEYDDEEFDISLKLKWEGRSTVEKMEFRLDKKFSELIAKLSSRENIDAKFFLLMLGDKIIDQDDTPRSVNYTIGKFIAVRVLDNLLPSYTSKTKNPSQDIDSLVLKIQTPQWKKPKTFKIKKTDTFKILTVIIAEELKCSPETLLLKFDGDTLELSTTPIDQDFEGDEILDLIFRK